MSGWHWQQWAIVVALSLGVMIAGTHHGQPKLDKDGKPFRYNFVSTCIVTGIYLFVLASSGFFG